MGLMGVCVIGTGTEFEGFQREMGTRRLGDWMERGVQAGGVCSSKKAAEGGEMKGVCVRNGGGGKQKSTLRLGALWKGTGVFGRMESGVVDRRAREGCL